MPSPLRISLILSLSIVGIGILAWLCMDLRDYLYVKFNINLWPNRTDRLIRSSRRQLRKLNESENRDGIRHFFTLVDGNEKKTIEEYCRSQNVSVDEFMTGVAVNDAKCWKIMKDELKLVFGPQPPLAKPPKTADEHLHYLTQDRRLEPLFFCLSAEEYDKVSRHLARGQLSDRYLGRLVAATINQRRAAVEEPIPSLSPPS